MSTSIFTRRHERLTDALTQAGLHGLVLNPGSSLRYTTGLEMHLMERPVVFYFMAHQTPVLVLPEFESGRARELPFEVDLCPYTEDPATWREAFRRAAHKTGIDARHIGVDPRALRFMELTYLQESAPAATFVSAEASLAGLRMYKDEAEIGTMRRAVAIAQEALQRTLPAVREGVTERALASELTANLLRCGSEAELPFSPILCFGENSANPHAVPSDRELRKNEVVLFDWGARFEGYCSDLTRCFAFGEVSEEMKRIADIVLRANLAGQQVSRPGIQAGEVDRAARRLITEEGYGEWFTHRTGHGLGLEDHEEPYIRDDNEQILEPGMTYTIEPGIYLPGKGGIRIEDDMVITQDGALSLSDAPRELITLPLQ